MDPNDYVVGDGDDDLDQEQLTAKILEVLKDVPVDLSKFSNNKRYVDDNDQNNNNNNSNSNNNQRYNPFNDASEDEEDDDVLYGDEDDQEEDDDEEEDTNDYDDDDLQNYSSFPQLNKLSAYLPKSSPAAPAAPVSTSSHSSLSYINHPPQPPVSREPSIPNTNSTFTSSISQIKGVAEELLEFLSSQGVTTIGLFSTMPDDGYMYSTDTIVAITYTEVLASCRKWITHGNFPVQQITQFLKPEYEGMRLSHPISLSVLNGFLNEDEDLLKTMNIFTLAHLSELWTDEHAKKAFSPRIIFYSFIAYTYSRYLELTKKVVIPPEKVIHVYHYTTFENLQNIEVRQNMKSVKALFEDYMNVNVSTRFNHPWRKVYFSYLNEATKHYKQTSGQLTDLDLYTYLVWRSSNSSGLSSTNCSNGVRAIFFFWKPILSVASLGPYHKEFESVIKINLTEVMKSKLPVYFCTNSNNVDNNNNNNNVNNNNKKNNNNNNNNNNNGDTELTNNTNSSNSRLDKENWFLASDDDILRECEKDYWREYSSFNRGMDPKVIIPHGCIITPLDGILPLNFYST